MSVLKLSITTGRPDAELVARYESGKGPKALVQSLSDYLLGVSSGTELGTGSAAPSIALSVNGSATAATGTVTFSNVATANDTVLINGVTFTAVASGATGNQWNVGTGASGSALGLATTVAASSTALITGVVTASASSGVTTVTASNSGFQGNSVTIAEGVDGGSVISVSGARLTGGLEDAAAVLLSF